MDQVKIEERTEIEGVYCPFSGGLCRMNCRFLIDVEQGCKNLERMRETLDEMQEQGLQKTIYED
jgi:hypothetical protein